MAIFVVIITSGCSNINSREAAAVGNRALLVGSGAESLVKKYFKLCQEGTESRAFIAPLLLFSGGLNSSRVSAILGVFFSRVVLKRQERNVQHLNLSSEFLTIYATSF